MKCSKYRKLLVEFVDGRLENQKTQEIYAHITECESCKNELDDLRSSIELVASDSILSREPKPPDNFPEYVLDRIHDGKTRPVFPFTFAVVAMVTVCLIGFTLWLLFYPQSSENEVWTYQSDNTSIKTDLPKIAVKHITKQLVTERSKETKNPKVRTFSTKNENLQQAKIHISMEILKLLEPTLEVIEGDEQEWEVEI